MIRAWPSVLLPAENGTTMRTIWFGYCSCANAAGLATQSAATPSNRVRNRVTVGTLDAGFLEHLREIGGLLANNLVEGRRVVRDPDEKLLCQLVFHLRSLQRRNPVLADLVADRLQRSR